ncbi:prepilin peptidase [Rhodococcus sp. SGAir0479]|uniref:prepilin peptidase n=1 Tax=Rhodococcus sp. SGAir0479 TaxID=2567884 RepID=UPI0010CCB1B7|nr:A24 family peptidase [Rhodococcus sp. SGAir0479]QCQ90655.1 prepilin peptidase [Rhodococcus sp. SGAir0479]
MNPTMWVANAAVGLLAGIAANVALERVGRESAPPGPDESAGPQASSGNSPTPPTPLPLERARRSTGSRLLVGLTAAVLSLAVVARLADLELLAAAPAYLWFAAVGSALTVIDVECKRLPNVLVVPSYPIVFACLTVASAITGEWPALGRAAVGAAVLFVFYLVLALIHPAGMGFGDVKLAGVIGALLAYLSYGVLVVGALQAFVLAAVAGVALLLTRRGRLGTTIPFGPYMIGAAFAAVLGADALVDAYLQWSGAA